MLKRLPILMFIALLVAVVGGVQAQDEPRVLRIGLTQEPDMLIDYPSNTLLGWSMARFHSQPQWGTNENGEIVPVLIDEVPSFENGGIEIVEDPSEEPLVEGEPAVDMVIRFRIADWAVWSDGTPITAADFLLPQDIATDGISQVVSFRFMGGFPGSVAQGETDKDVILTFEDPNPDWLYGAIVPLPAHILRESYEADLAEGRGFEQNAWIREPTVSNGPFVFDEWVTGSFIRFVKNPNYWKDVWFDEVQFQFYDDVSVLEQLMIAGDMDLTSYILPAARAAELAEENENLAIKTYFIGIRLELGFNLGPNGHPALQDERVRRAIGMGIDRQFMVEEVYGGVAEPAYSWWSGTPWFNEETPIYEYDPEAAVALLREAGWYDEDGDGVAEAHGVEGVDDGTPLEMTATTYADIQHYQDSLLYLQDALSDIGLSFDINNYPVGEIHGSFTSNAPLATGQFDLYLIAWVPGVSTIGTFNPYDCADIPSEENPNGLNGVQVCDERLDELFSMMDVELDAEARQAQSDEIQVIMAENSYTQYLVNVLSVDTYNARLVFQRTPTSDLTPWLYVNEWQFAE